MSVRLKLTLSYAAFLMVAGVVLLAVVWVFLLRYVPEVIITPAPVPNRSDLERAFAPRVAAVLVFLVVSGLLGGWLLAGRMLAPLTRITRATRLAATGSLSHRIQMEGRSDEFRELADAFDTMLARLEAHVAEQQRFAANASHELRTPLAITQTLLDVARNDPGRDATELVERLHFVNTRAIELTEALLLLSRADQRSFTRDHVDLSLIAEEATETLLPLAEERGLTIETSGDIAPAIGSHALLLQMATNLVHNAIVHNLPQQGAVWVMTSIHPTTVELTVENTGRAAHPAVGVHARRAVPARHWTDPRRPRRRRPRPGDRQEHQRSTRRNPHPHPAPRWGAPRHRATTNGAIARGRMTIRGCPTGTTLRRWFAAPPARPRTPPDSRFCNGCGTRLTSSAPAGVTEERKVITALFCDLVGFTATSEGADPEDVDRMLTRYFQTARSQIELHGGVVEKFIGDAVVGVFGVPLAHGDDPERAVRAALRIADDAAGLQALNGAPLQAADRDQHRRSSRPARSRSRSRGAVPGR